MSTEAVVIVGGGLAAARTAQHLRRRGHKGLLSLVADEGHSPYDRPPLSKAVLHGEREETTLPVDLTALDVDVRLATTAESLDLKHSLVRTTGGSLPFDRLVVATGARPLLVPGQGEQLSLRTIDDARRMRDRLAPGTRTVIIGASWIGAEVATAALAKGASVTVLEAGAAPLSGALGAEGGELTRDWWSEVDLRTDVQVAEVGVDSVLCTDGTEVPADTVVTGVGVRASTDWLKGSGLALERGVLVDEHLRSTDPRVIALGDVAARHSPRYGRTLRVQHWDSASMAAATAASNTLQSREAEGDALVTFDPVPYFWSDQWGHRLQYVGAHSPDDTLTVETDDEPGTTATWRDASGRPTAVLTIDRPRASAAAQRELSKAPDGC